MLPCHRETSMIGFQLIPARGRKLVNIDSFIVHYPRKGTETREPSAGTYGSLRFQLIPARGRKLNVALVLCHFVDISTYPRKGTETRHPHAAGCTIDGFQLIPARGRKHRGGQERALTILFQLIPARERKHKEDDSGFYFAELFQLIPARGRKRRRCYNRRVIFRISTYPRKGTKTVHTTTSARVVRISTYPRKGTETSLHSLLMMVRNFNLSPQKPSQALRASSPEGSAFPAATYLVLSSPFRGSWHGVSRD